MLASWLARRWRRAIRGRQKHRVRLTLEALEPRWLPSTIYVVTNTTNSGTGSLYDAIQTANGSPGTVIDFNIVSGGPATITPTAALPTITADGTVIDGTTQPGYTGSPLIVLEGTGSGFDGLTITAANCTIAGLAINNFDNGLTIQDSTATGTVVRDCYIGTDATGTIAESNAGNGVQILAGASSNVIGPGDVISGNGLNGIVIDAVNAKNKVIPTSDNVIKGDFIGTTPDGLTPLGNIRRGIYVRGGTFNTIGGTTPADRNIVSANGHEPKGSYTGIVLALNGANYNVIEGNYVGVDANGNASVPMENSAWGIDCGANANFNVIGLSGAEALQEEQTGVTINAGNLIGPNGRFGDSSALDGVGINDHDPQNGKFLGTGAGVGNTILGNRIYENPAGSNAIALSTDGGNDNQAAPVLQTAFTSAGGVTTVSGTLTSPDTPNMPFVLEFFASSTGSPPQGDIFLGRSSMIDPNVMTTDASGHLSFTVSGLAPVQLGQYVTATATPLNGTATTHVGDTSGFSAAIAGTTPTQLTFAVQPSGTTAGVAISPTVTVQMLDQNGNLCTDDTTDQVTLTVAGGPGGFASSPPPVTVQGGVATFGNLVLDTAGSYTLGETATGGITGPASAKFVIQPGSMSLAQSVVSVSPSSIAAGTTATLTLQAKDAYGNDETSGGLAVQFGLGAGLGQGTFGAVTDHNDGTYTAVLTGTTAGSNTITATIGGQTASSTAPTLTVTPGTVSLSQSTISVAPTSIQLNATATVTLQAKDAFGNNETAGGLTVQCALGTGTGQGTFGFVQDNHNGTYTAIFTGTVADSNTITATINGQNVTSTPAPIIIVGPVDLSQSTVTVSRAGIAAGSTSTVTLHTRDAYGHAEPVGGLTVVFGLGTGVGQGTFGSVTDPNDGTYTAVFTGTIAGSNTVTATVAGQAVTSAAPTITITPGSVSLAQSVVTLSPGSITAGTTATVTLQARDAYGNDETSGGLAVQFGLGAGMGQGTFGAVTDHNDGTYTAVLTGTTAGSNTITATIGGHAVTSTAPTFAVSPGVVSLVQSLVLVAPATVPTHATTTVTLQATDAYGNDEPGGGLAVQFGLGTGVGQGNFGSVQDNQDGTYTATFTGMVLGSNTITATIGGQPVTSAAPTLTITSAPATQLVLQLPASVVVGGRFTATVLAEDPYGDTDPTFSGLATLVTSTGPAGGKLAGVRIAPLVNGVATFNGLSLHAVGNYTLLAASTGDLPANAATVDVVNPAKAPPTTATHVGADFQAPNSNTGQAVTLTVTPLTAADQPAAFQDVLAFKSSDPRAVLPPETVFSAGSNGAMTFSVTFLTPGQQTVTVTDVSRPTFAASASVNVRPVIAAFRVSGFPTTDTTGAVHNVTITAVEADGAVLTSYTGTVTIASSSNPGTALATADFSSANKGIVTVPVALTTLGTQALIARDTNGITGDEPNIQVFSPATHLQLQVSGVPRTPGLTAGSSFSLTLTGLTAAGKLDILFADDLVVTSTDRKAAINAAPPVGGVQSFTVTLYTAGSQTIRVRDLTRPAFTVPAFTIGVIPAVAAQLGVTGFPSSTLAGTSHAFTVTAEDAYGNRVTTAFTDTITLTGMATPMSYTFQPGDRGLHVFTTALTTAGTASLTATDTSNGNVTAGSEANIAVLVGLTCGVTPPSFDLPGQPNGVPGQPLPFTLNAIQSGIPADTAFTFQIGWNGNGSVVQTVFGPTGLTASHVYPAAGTYAIELTVFDAAGEVVGHAAQTVTIQPVILEADPDPFHSGDTALAIGAPPTGATIVISPSPGAVPIAVSFNGKAQAIPTPPSPIGLLLAYGESGRVSIMEVAGAGGSQVTIPAVALGGTGTDTFSAADSSANNVLVGGPGGSVLTGGSGRDILIGGRGAATLHAGSGDDILIGGRTAYDANLPALLALMAEWSSGDGYEQRIQALFGTSSGGLNGPYFLDAQTVARDTARTQLLGGPGSDWFWFTDHGTLVDSISNYLAGEVATFE
jgi:hypothetical protein